MDYLIHLNLEKRIKHTLSMPFIYALIVPVILLDIFIELYHRICFPLYDLELINRSDYVRIDRHKLEYLSLKHKINCVYCGYVNGAFAYWVKIAAETEKYWCGIQHELQKQYKEPGHHKDFVPYNDELAFKDKFKKTSEQSNEFKLEN